MTRQMITMPRPRMTVRGEFGSDLDDLFVRKLAPVSRHVHGPVLDVRVRVTRHADPAVAAPVEVLVTMDVNGHPIQAEASAGNVRDAADRVVDRLVRRLEDRRGHRGRHPR